MENILSSLSSLPETWLAFGSASCHVDLNYNLLSGLGLLLLYICYLILKLVLSSLWKKEYPQKLQEKAKETRESLKGHDPAFPGGRTGGSDAEDVSRRQTILQSSPGPSYDPTGFHQLLCQDSLCNVCNKASDEVSSQLSQTPLEDSTDLTSHWPSTVSVTESTSSLISHFPENQPGPPVPEVILQPSPSPLSTLSSYQTTWDGLSSPRPLTASPAPHAQAPLDPPVLLSHTPHKPFAPFPLLHATQEAQSVLQPEAPLSLEESPRELSPNVPRAKGIVYEGQAVSTSSQPWSSAKDQSLTRDTINQQPLDPCAPQASDQKLTETHTVEPRSSLTHTPEVLALFKRQEKMENDFTASEYKKEEAESFLMPLNNSGKISGSITGPKNLEVSLPLGNGKGNSGDPHLLQQPSLPKTSEDQSDIKDSQLFWGLPCLHSESLKHEAEAIHTAHFNRMAKAPTGNESPACTQPAPLPWLERDQQVWLQTLPESQTKPDSHSKSEAPQPQIQWPLSSPLSQLKTCGVHFHRPSDGAQPLSPSEIHQLEYNLLQKALESVLGLPTVTQRSQESFCPSPPKVSLMRKSFKSCDPKSIQPGDFPLTGEVRRKLEHHLRKRLIQHLWGLPHRVQDSLSLMSPHPEPSEFPEIQSSHGPSWISLYRHNGSRHPSSIKLIQSESFHKKILETHPLREKDVQIQRQGPRTDQKDHLQGESPGATMSREGSDSETDPELQPWNLSGKFAKPSWVKQCQKKCETFLQEQLSRKTEETREGEIPGTKDRGPHSNNMAQPPPETLLEDLALLAGEEDPLENHQHSLSISPSKEKILEEHIKTFGRRMSFGLPQRVEESLKSYKKKVGPSHPPSQFHVPSHVVSAVGSAQTSSFRQRNTSGGGMGTLNVTPIHDVPLPAPWPVSQIRPASENKVFVDKDLSTAQSGREPIQSWTPGMVDKGSLQQSGSDHRHSPELPMRPDGPTDERLASSTNTQELQGARISLEAGSMAEGSMELLKGDEIPDLHPQSTKILAATQGTCSPGRDLMSCQPLQGMSVPHIPGTSDYKSQVSRGVGLHSESRPPIQAAGLPGVPSASEEMTSKPQGPSSGDMVASQVLWVHLPTAGVNMETGQGPWFPANVSGKCQNKECPPAAKRVSPLAAEAGKLGGGDAGLGTSQSRGKRVSVQARAPEETHGPTSSPLLSPRGQPLENQFTSQVKCFLQWMSPGRKHKGQERSLAKGSFSSPPVKGTSLIKGRCEFCENIEALKYVRDPGVILRKPLGHRQGTVIPCPQAPVPPFMGSEETQQEVQLLAQAEPVHRHLSCWQAACSQVQRAESCSPGQGQTAPKRCGTAGKAEMVTSPMQSSQGTRVPPKSCL